MRGTGAVAMKNGRSGVAGTCAVRRSGTFRIGVADDWPGGLGGEGRESLPQKNLGGWVGKSALHFTHDLRLDDLLVPQIPEGALEGFGGRVDLIVLVDS